MTNFHVLEQLSLQPWGYHRMVNLFAKQTGFPRDDKLDHRSCGNSFFTLAEI